MKKITFLSLLLLGVTAFAQQVPPPNPGPPGFSINTALWILGAVAIGFGVYKISNNSKTKKS